MPGFIRQPVTMAVQIRNICPEWLFNRDTEMGAFLMIRTICSSICGALMFIAAMIPAMILVIDKIGF